MVNLGAGLDARQGSDCMGAQMMPSNRQWLKDAERVTAAALKRRKGRKRRKPRLMEAMNAAEEAKAKAAETRAKTKRRKQDALKPPAAGQDR